MSEEEETNINTYIVSFNYIDTKEDIHYQTKRQYNIKIKGICSFFLLLAFCVFLNKSEIKNLLPIVNTYQVNRFFPPTLFRCDASIFSQRFSLFFFF